MVFVAFGPLAYFNFVALKMPLTKRNPTNIELISISIVGVKTLNCYFSNQDTKIEHYSGMGILIFLASVNSKFVYIHPIVYGL